MLELIVQTLKTQNSLTSAELAAAAISAGVSRASREADVRGPIIRIMTKRHPHRFKYHGPKWMLDTREHR